MKRLLRLPGAESARVLLLIAAAVGVTLPYFTRWLTGGIDARWYAYMLKDFIDQERAGHFPVFIGQGWYAWNGAVHPFRSAPAFMYLAGIWDFATGRSLGVPWLQHLTMITSAIAGVLGFYAAAAALAPKRRPEAALLAVLYLWGGGWLTAIYWADAYMTYMAFAALPLVAYGNARSLLTGEGRGYGFLAVGLALTWMCHPPVAMLATLGTAILQGGAVLCGDFPRAQWRGALAGAALFAGLSAYYFAAMSELPGPRSGVDPLPLLGLALALAGLVRGLIRGRWAWLVLLVAGEALLRRVYPPWFWWMAAASVLALALAGTARWRRWFDPGSRACELLLLCLLAGAGLADALLGPARAGSDAPALRALQDNAAAGAGFVWPLPSIAHNQGDLRLGPGLWLVLILLGASFIRRRPLAVKLFFMAAVLPALGLVRIPWISDFLAASFPVDLQLICNFPFSLRLVPALSVLVAMGGAVWLATEPAEPPRFRPWLIGLLATGVAWAGAEAVGFAQRGWDTRSNAFLTQRNFRSENVVLDRYAYDLLPLPAYFSNGPTDPRLEVRLLDAAEKVAYGPEEAARLMEGEGRRVIRLTSRQDPTAAAWLMIEPGLTLQPGEHVLLRFDFDPGRDYSGYLILRSEHGYREYHLPDSGMAQAFGAGPGCSHVISLWNSGMEPEHYVLSMPRQPGNDLDAKGGLFATLTVSEYREWLSPARLEALDPLRVLVREARAGWLETERVYLPGYRATVDDQPAPVVSSPERLAMIPVPAGRHSIELRYVGTTRVWLAAALSLLAWSAAGLGLVWSWTRSCAPIRGIMESALFLRMMRFALVGATVMATFMALNWLFGHAFGKQAAFLLSYPPALGLHFYLNKRWTFGCDRSDTRRQVGEYLVMVAATFIVQWAVFTALTNWSTMPGWLAAGLANAAQMGITFVVMQRRIFAVRAES